MWNTPPTHLKSAPNGTAFKRGLRKHVRMEMDIFIDGLHEILYIIQNLTPD